MLVISATELLAGMPFGQDPNRQEGQWEQYLYKTLTSMVRQEKLAKKVPALTQSVRIAYDRLAAQRQSEFK